LTGAAAWLPDHLAPASVMTLAPSYRLERGLLGVLAGSIIGLLLGVCAGLLAVGVAALATGLVLLLAFLALVGRYVALPFWPRKIAAQVRVWRVQLSLVRLGALGRVAERQLRQLDERETRALTAVAERRQGYARELREALTALDRASARFAVERQLLDQAEDEELTHALQDLRQHHAADHLVGYPVLAAAIPGIGPQLKLRLLTAGIRTAAQIRDLRVTPALAGAGAGETVEIEVPGRGFVQVQGLGRQKAQALVSWRQLLEAEAVALLPEALPSAEESAIRLRYHTRREGLARREATATRAADRRRDVLAAQLRARHVALDRQEATLRDRAAQPRARGEAILTERQTAVAAAHLALALARRDLAAYERVRFTSYLQGILFS
jgi:DNA-binding helix-hairpin-helix protein with protein kinase domain